MHTYAVGFLWFLFQLLCLKKTDDKHFFWLNFRTFRLCLIEEYRYTIQNIKQYHQIELSNNILISVDTNLFNESTIVISTKRCKYFQYDMFVDYYLPFKKQFKIFTIQKVVEPIAADHKHTFFMLHRIIPTVVFDL